jgi:phage terminase large subunit-like protein
MNPIRAFHLLTKLPPDELAQAIKATLATSTLSDFVRYAWHVHHEHEPLLWGWHIDCLCEHLEALWRHEIEWLIINIPPGFSKSLLTSVYFPSWVWLQQPQTRFLCCSTNDIVTYRDARRQRDLIDSDWYKRLFMPAWSLSKTQKAHGSFANTAGGERVSRTVRASIVGARPHCKLIDDPNDPMKSDTEECSKVNSWLSEVLLKRRILGQPDCLGLIQQRTAEMDASGYLLERAQKPKTVHLCLPNEHDPARTFVSTVPRRETGEVWVDPRDKEGELLCEGLKDREASDAEKASDPATYSAQDLQDPTPAAGIIFLRSMFQRWSYEPRPSDPEHPTIALPGEFDYSFITVDPNNLKDENKNTANTDYCPIDLWGVKNDFLYLRTEVRDKLSEGAAVNAIINFLDHYRDEVCAILIEKSASGPTMIGVLRALLNLAHECDLEECYQLVRPWAVQGESKVQRAKGALPVVAANKVVIPSEQEFGEFDYWLAEVTGFPRRRRDDRVDNLTAAVKFKESKPFG